MRRKLTLNSLPRKVEDIFEDFSGRKSGILGALTTDFAKFFRLCNPGEKNNLSLYGYPNGSWEVRVPPNDVPTEIPEPASGINFTRDEMKTKQWISFICAHSDAWLLSFAFYCGCELNKNERIHLFSLINEQPTVYEVVKGKKMGKGKSNADSGSKSKDKLDADSGSKSILKTKRSSNRSLRINPSPNLSMETNEQGRDDESHCGSCGAIYIDGEFWIRCDFCGSWYHGSCVKVTSEMADDMDNYECLSCRMGSSR